MRPLTRLAGQVSRPRRVHCATCRRPLRLHDPVHAQRAAFHSSPWRQASEASSSKRKEEEDSNEPVFIASGTVKDLGSDSYGVESPLRVEKTRQSSDSLDPIDSTVAEPPDAARSSSSSSSSRIDDIPYPAPPLKPPPLNLRPAEPPISYSPPTSITSEWRKTLENHFRRLTRESEKKLTEVGLKINEVTGYDEVERLKSVVAESEARLTESRSDARAAKTAYDTAVQARSNAQHEVNILLERKHSWTDTDVSAFTSLVRRDHISSNSVTTTSAALRDAETTVDTAFSDLTKSILQRYHEEQVWSDKIRNVSTWVNLAGLVINLVVFVGALAIVEPWKRRRLVERVEERMGEMMARVEGEVKEVARLVAPQAVLVDDRPIIEEVVDRLDPPAGVAGTTATPSWLSMVFQSPAWRKTAGYVVEPSLETDLALAGGICVTLGIALGTIITTLMR